VTTDNKPPQIPVVIGTVFQARRVLRVEAIEKLDGEAQLSFGDRIQKALGLGPSFKLSAKADSGNSHSVEFVGNAIIPVAYAPVFDITKTNIAEQGETTLQIAEVNPEEIRVNVALMETLLSSNNWAAILSRDPRDPFSAFRRGNEPPKFVLG